ncbi:MAG: NUDIX domain-containing protein [archaeon]
MKIRKAVFIVTYAIAKGKIKYLILKRKLHWKGWEFPKGGVERFELKKSAVKRELKEELGLSPIKINSFSEKGIYKYNKEYADRKGFVGQSYKLYSAEVKFSKKIKLDKYEHSDYKWMDFNTTIKKLTWPNQRKCLKIVNKFLSSDKV